VKITAINKNNSAFFRSFLPAGVQDLMDADAPLTAIGLVDEETACGILTGYAEDATFLINALYVAPDYRNRGGGIELMNALLAVLYDERDILYVRANFTMTCDEHMLLIPFFEACGFEFEEEEQTIYMTMVGLASISPFFSSANMTNNYQILPFSELPDIYVKMFITGMPVERATLDRDLSIGVVRGGAIEAGIVFDRSFDGRLTLAYAKSGTGREAPMLFSAMLYESFRHALSKYPPETPVYINAVTPLSAALVKRLIGDICMAVSVSAVKELTETAGFEYLLG
jgi:GNAT superfamily N-acetyltransferase